MHLSSLCRAANPSANPSGTLQKFFRDIHKISGTFFHDNFMGQIRILHFENMLPPFAKLHLVSARATAAACELLQWLVALFGFNWCSFSWKKLRRFDQVWMKFYILNISLRADTDEKMRCMLKFVFMNIFQQNLWFPYYLRCHPYCVIFLPFPYHVPEIPGRLAALFMLIVKFCYDKTCYEDIQLHC